MMTAAQADKRYLLFKDTGATTRGGTDYKLQSYVIERAWDSNYRTTVWLVTVFGLLDLFLSCFSYF